MTFKDEAEQIIDNALNGMHLTAMRLERIDTALNSLVELHKQILREAIGKDEDTVSMIENYDYDRAHVRNELRDYIRKKAGL